MKHLTSILAGIISLVLLVFFPNVRTIILAVVINVIAYSHKKFVPTIPISLELSPALSLWAYHLHGANMAYVVGFATVILAIIFCQRFHPWNFVRLASVWLTIFVMTLVNVESMVFYIGLILFNTIVLFVIYLATGMNLVMNITHQGSNAVANSIAIMYLT